MKNSRKLVRLKYLRNQLRRKRCQSKPLTFWLLYATDPVTQLRPKALQVNRLQGGVVSI